LVDNALSPHGGKLVERILAPAEASAKIQGLKTIAVRDQIAAECVGIAYGFFSPLEGFMMREDLDAVVKHMRLANGYVWSIPIVYDVSEEEIKELGLKEGETVLFTYQGQPLATLEIEEIYSCDKALIAKEIYGTSEEKHPGVRRTYAYKDKFLGGKVTVVNPPQVNSPFDRFWYTPKELRAKFAEQGWKRIVAHQSRNVPHAGHEWLMKGAWFAAKADAILVNAVIGEKKAGDYIDEAIVLGHATLREAGYFRENVHMTSILLWDMRYAGPKEAVFHALVRKNLGCTHHMFGRDHAGVGKYYHPYAAHRIFQEIPDIGIEPVETLEWWFCPICGVAYEGFCGHPDRKQDVSGTWLRSIIQNGTRPEANVFRPEVFDVMLECGQKYGFGSPFVDERYLQNRKPVISLPSAKLSQKRT